MVEPSSPSVTETPEGVTTIRWGKVPAWWMHHPDVDADRLAVLAALATYADADGWCDPSQATLARWLQRSRPWVNRVIADLAIAGLLEKTARHRPNHGTTSCLYRLRTALPEGSEMANRTVSVGDSSGQADDSPCHEANRSQDVTEQTQRTRSPARALENDLGREPAPSPSGLYLKQERDHRIPVPSDWQPSAAAMAAARGCAEDAVILRHAQRFVLRCQAKGYRYAPSGIDAAWLSWLIDDLPRLTESQASDTTPRRFTNPGRPRPRGGQEARFERMRAWGEAAKLQVAMDGGQTT